MSDKIEYYAYKTFEWIVLKTPKKMAKVFLDLLANITFVVDFAHKKVCQANLDLAFGESLTQSRKIEIIKNSYKSIFYNLYEFVINQNLSSDQIVSKAKVVNENFMLDALASKKPIIMITAHYGNWEMISLFCSIKYKPMAVVGRPLDNDLLNDDLRKARNQQNCQMLDRTGASKGIIKAIKEDKMIGLVIDQHIGEDKGGIWIKAFGREALQSDSPARLALKFDGIILPAFAIMKDLGNYEIKFLEPVDLGSNDIYEITQAQSDLIEKQIREYPDVWFWQHKRWKGKFKHIYQ